MAKRLYIFSFNRFSISAIVAIVLIVSSELSVFSRARILLDRTALLRYHKSVVIKNGPDWDIAIFGTSRGLAINAKILEESLANSRTVYNLAVAETNHSALLYFVLKSYLKHNKPDLILFEIPVENFGFDEKDELGEYPDHLDGVPIVLKGDRNSFCSLFDPGLFFGELSSRTCAELLCVYLKRAVPSFRYKKYIQRAFPIDIFYNIHALILATVGESTIFRQTIRDNHRLLSHIDATHGQVLYDEDKFVSDDQLQRATPLHPKNLGGAGNKNIWIKKFIELADKNGIKTVFFFMPVESSRYEKMRKLGWFDYAKEQFRIYEEKYKNFEYHEDKDLSYDKRFFGDWSHLNRDGAGKFNEQFAPKFKNIVQNAKIAQ